MDDMATTNNEAEHEEYIEELKKSQIDQPFSMVKSKSIESDVKKISSEYVSGILQKIGGNTVEEKKDSDGSEEEEVDEEAGTKVQKEKKEEPKGPGLKEAIAIIL